MHWLLFSCCKLFSSTTFSNSSTELATYDVLGCRVVHCICTCLEQWTPGWMIDCPIDFGGRLATNKSVNSEVNSEHPSGHPHPLEAHIWATPFFLQERRQTLTHEVAKPSRECLLPRFEALRCSYSRSTTWVRFCMSYISWGLALREALRTKSPEGGRGAQCPKLPKFCLI